MMTSPIANAHKLTASLGPGKGAPPVAGLVLKKRSTMRLSSSPVTGLSAETTAINQMEPIRASPSRTNARITRRRLSSIWVYLATAAVPLAAFTILPPDCRCWP